MRKHAEAVSSEGDEVAARMAAARWARVGGPDFYPKSGLGVLGLRVQGTIPQTRNPPGFRAASGNKNKSTLSSASALRKVAGPPAHERLKATKLESNFWGPVYRGAVLFWGRS